MPFIRSISGLRATVGQGLQPALLSSYAAAFAEYCAPGPIAIGRDGRPSGAWIEQIIAGTLQACGRDVLLLGIAPTPTVQLITEHTDCTGGISISASHNPAEWNGLKFLGADGVFLNASQNQEFWNIVDKGGHFSSTVRIGKILPITNAVEKHCNAVEQALLQMGAAPLQQGTNYTVVVDAVNASGSKYIPHLLTKAGCTTIPLYCDETGIFPHIPEPLAVNLQDLSRQVVEKKADFGVAVDPDADRLVLIDENGKPIGEEKTIALSVWAALLLHAQQSASSLSNQPAIVINLSTSGMAAMIARQFGALCYRTAVGEINVVSGIKEKKALIGGEGSGGVILPACHFGRDSLVGLALIITLLREKQLTLSQAAGSLPQLFMEKDKQILQGKQSHEILNTIEREFHHKAQSISHEDGLWMDFGESWMHVRASNTEPILRFIVEAATPDSVTQLMEKIRTIINESNT
jgi:phosphomannomutase